YMSPYHRFGSLVPASEHESSFFEGIDVSLMGIAGLAHGGDTAFLKDGLAQINAVVETAMKSFSAEHPEAVAHTLVQGLKATNDLLDKVAGSSLDDESKYDVTHELKVKQAQFANAITESLGLSMLATVAPDKEPSGIFARFFPNPESFQVAIPGQQFHVKVHTTNPVNVPVQVESITLQNPPAEQWKTQAEGPAAATLVNNQSQDVRFTVDVPDDAAYTRPYFSRPDIEQPYYDVQNPKYLDRPLAPYPLFATLHLSLDGVPFELSQAVQAVNRVTGPGTVFQPLIVGPAISVSISPHAGIVPLNSKAFGLAVTVHSNVKGPAKGMVKLDLPPGWQAPQQAFSTLKDGEDQTLNFQVTPGNIKQQPYTLTAVATYGGREYKQGYHTVGYAGLRPYDLYRAAAYRTTGVDVKVAPGLSVGYIVGAGDDVPQSLVNLGIHVHFITPEELAGGDLSKFNVIITGVRAYAVREDLKTYNNRLLEYVKNGGVAIVQYNTPEYDHNFGPYPYQMGHNPEEVTDESSAMQILQPGNPLFTWPNRITARDFNGWVEERGSKFLESWDPHYQALLETHDPGQAPQKGGLVYAKYGKGVYIYCAYAFYRELPEGVPGAYRIFANMVSLGKNPRAGGGVLAARNGK
ncbi:MAG TPA: PIG-L family deacetylase, partial [Terriglobales bacterium]|nr:PIG-L family deacetylase [Terriglobales bacterium]